MRHESLGQITSCWVGQDKQGRYSIEECWESVQSKPRMMLGWTYSREAARRVAQVCIKMYMGLMSRFTRKEKD